MLKLKKPSPLILIFCAMLSVVAGCADKEPFEPTPEAAKKFLKLRGYEFDGPSFFRAAEAGDAMAINGFIAAGIDVNGHDGNGDTVLTVAAARGDLPVRREFRTCAGRANSRTIPVRQTCFGSSVLHSSPTGRSVQP